MFKKSLLSLTLVLAAAAVQAQSPAPVTSPPLASSPAKKELAARILKAQQPGIENMARGLVEQPAIELLNSAGNVIAARVPKDKQDAMAKEIQADVQKYLEETAPVVQARAVRLAPTTIGTLLEEKFTEDELKQIVGIIESPVYIRFQRLGDDMHRSLVEKLLADTRPTVEPKVKALEQTVAKRLGIPTTPQASGAGPARPAAPRASGSRP